MKKIILMTWLLILLGGCSKPEFKGADISNGPIGGDFKLTDHHGKLRSLQDFKGKVVVLFFGFTQCPEVCPTTLSELKSAMQQLGEKANRVQVLFVTVDPERDSQKILAAYIPAFDARFLGLHGNAAQLADMAQKYRIIYQKQIQGDSYTMDHTAGSYLIDPQGNTRVMVNYGAGAAVFAHDLDLLLAE
ncbi:SCO family protein [uncultured Deefgea sp.]|uniref:SCO family protein n=1 Tax=uncultured Deefgea sp. TaxID=1304914 RepID=UPI0026374692|nr:SCO family protein [uncultured Deefgea sp.]